MDRRTVEVMRLVFCPSCGSPTAPSDRFCENCGTPIPLTPGYVPYVPMARPSHDRTAMIVVIVIVVVLAGTVGMSALLYVMVSGLIGTGPPSPIFFGVTTTRSADGTNWTLTFTSVPSNVNPSVTYLGLLSASGAEVIPLTTFTSLSGGMVSLSSGLGSLYVRYTGQTTGVVSAGDFLSIGTVTSLGTATVGFQGRIMFAASIVWSGTLQ